MSLEKITLISTSLNTADAMNRLFAEEFPDVTIANIVDDCLVKEVLANENVISSSVVRRVCSYVVSAELSGANLVVITCSTISPTARVAERLVGIPVLRIDEPLAERAVERGDRIKVLATISSTLAPSVELLREKSRQKGKEIVLDSSLCKKARQFLDEGNPQEHDRILREEIEISLKQFDLIVLAQASMRRVLDTLDAKERNRVLTSPTLAIEHIRKRYVSPV